jgi:hypothetical protein
MTFLGAHKSNDELTPADLLSYETLISSDDEARTTLPRILPLRGIDETNLYDYENVLLYLNPMGFDRIIDHVVDYLLESTSNREENIFDGLCFLLVDNKRYISEVILPWAKVVDKKRLATLIGKFSQLHIHWKLEHWPLEAYRETTPFANLVAILIDEI